jgi:hypothetical protein
MVAQCDRNRPAKTLLRVIHERSSRFPAMTATQPKRRTKLRLLLWTFAVFVGLVCSVIGLLYWGRFHPSDLTPIVGPAGPKHRAFVEDRSFSDISLVACASDWPYTFRGPFALGTLTFPEAYSSAKLFWSRDGSVLAFLVVHRGKTEEVYETAYDFRDHVSLQYRHDQIAALIQARGGLGPQFNEYSERKGDG